ncbi:interleukin-9 receptor-like isoform X2 [Sagmatias obliquidens]|uniref:interleukin-9 receptor-like isoform X2 n=1 Tax=Sagmatias obliquidens TaxID=3371155 RepID=UPI000F440F0E|nr:interleukin-9 receptor-like isoform X2 [Lagenorhynchus obliquidens]
MHQPHDRGLLWPGSSPGSRLDIAERGPDARGGHLAPDLHLHLRLGRLGRLCPRGQRSPALKQPLWACKGHCSQGLGLSRATPTTSSGLTATGLPQSWARGPAPGCSSPATTLQAASTGASSGPACAQWSCHPRRCSCLLTTSPSPSTVTSLGRSRSAWWIHSTCPGDMLDPPSDLLSNITSDHCVLTWSINPALEPLASLLSYELAFKRQEETWERARHKDHIVGVTWLKLEATELDPGSTYEARLRVQMATPEDAVAEEERYEGPWSDWSQPARFHSPQRQEVLERISDPGDLMDGKGKAQGCVIHPEYSRRRDINLPFWPEAPIQVLLPGEFGGTQPWALPAIGLLVPALGQRDSTLVSVSIFLLLTSLTYLLFKLSPRMKTALYQDVPSPGPFFQSLYSVHNGDFQTWIGAHRAGPEPSPDCTGPARGAWETRVREAIALLTYDPVDVGPLAGLEEEGSTGTGLPADALPTGCVEEGGPLPAYLPQEAWPPAGPTSLAPPQSQGNSSDYCALGCSRWGCPSTFTGSAQSSEPDAALACGPFCDQQSLDARPGGNCAGVGHSQRQDAGGWAA